MNRTASIRIGIVFTAIAVVAPGGLQGQGVKAVEVRLRALLKPTPQESLYITRDSSRVFFPKVTFYRGEVTRAGWHLKTRLAVIATTAQDTIAATSVADVPSLWSALSNGEEEGDATWQGVDALLGTTGFIGYNLRVLASSRDLPQAFKVLLDPQETLDSISAPGFTTIGGARVFTSYVGTTWGVFKVSITEKMDRAITLTIDTVALLRET